MTQFKEIAKGVAQELEKKNLAYGNAFDKTTKMLLLLYPQGIPVTSYPDIHVIVRMLDKISRIAQNKDPYGESPYLDLAGYAILATANKEAAKKKK
jgi:tRNA A37 threonylcarbamoyltransferase TsaD